MTLRVALAQQRRQAPIDHALVEVDVQDVELHAERLPHCLLGEHPELQERFSEGPARLPVTLQGRLELRRRDRARPDQQLPEPRPLLVQLEDVGELALGDRPVADEDLPEGLVGLERGLDAHRLLELRLGDEALPGQEVSEAPGGRGGAAPAVMVISRRRIR